MPDFDESNFDFARIDEIMAGLPPALQSMLSPDAAENIEEISKPIHKKCETIRRRVGQGYRSSVLNKTVCLKLAPESEGDQ